MLQSAVKKLEKKEEMNKGIHNTGDIPLETLVYSLAEIISQCIYVFISQIPSIHLLL